MALAREKTIEQLVTPRQRQAKSGASSRFGKERLAVYWVRLQFWAKVGFLALGFPLALWGTYSFANSKVFALGPVEIAGNDRVPVREIERTVRQSVTGSLLTTSLVEIKNNLEMLTWVKTAQITRVLPNTVRIRIEERKPLLLAQIDGKDDFAWMDEDGTVLGGYDVVKDQKDLPPITLGFTADRSEKGRAENRDRIDTYKKLMWALDSGTPKYSERLESIDLTHPEDVTVHLSQSKVMVHLGNEEYRGRIVRAVEVLDIVQRRDAAALEKLHITDPRILQFADRISSVSVINPVQVSLEFRSGGEPVATTAKPADSKPAAKKATAQRPPDKKKKR